MVTSRSCLVSEFIDQPCAFSPEPAPYEMADSTAATRVVHWGGREYLEVTVSW